MTKMRDSTGGAFADARGRLFIRVTVAPQKRPAKLVPWAQSLDEAAARAHLVQGWVNRLRLAEQHEFIKTILAFGARADDAAQIQKIAEKVDALTAGEFERIEQPKAKPGGPATFRTFAERWTGGELAKLYPDHVEEKASVQDDIERLEKHVYPHVQHVPLRSFTREHADGVMAKLDPSLSKATRRQVAQLVNRVLRLAVFAGEIKASPLPPGWLPKAPKADSIAKESLLPSEEAMVLGGRSEAGEVVVPFAFRALYAFLHREGMRKGEARALEWPDVDLKRGLVALDENKTDRPRSWMLAPDVQRVLTAWHDMQGKPKAGRVFAAIPDPAWEKLAPIYRDHCKAVGIERGRLFQRKANKLRLRAHDTRAFFVTASMFNGRDALWITDRSGHTTIAMLRRYERDVRRWRELGETLVDVDQAIPEVAAVIAAAERGSKSDGGARDDRASARKCTGRDSNPHASRRRNLKPDRHAEDGAPPQKTAGDPSDNRRASAEPGGLLPPPAAASDATDADLERRIVEAELGGRQTVADVLARQLEARRQARAGNVVPLDAKRRARRA